MPQFPSSNDNIRKRPNERSSRSWFKLKFIKLIILVISLYFLKFLMKSLTLIHGANGFRGTPVGKHCSLVYYYELPPPPDKDKTLSDGTKRRRQNGRRQPGTWVNGARLPELNTRPLRRTKFT